MSRELIRKKRNSDRPTFLVYAKYGNARDFDYEIVCGELGMIMQNGGNLLFHWCKERIIQICM